MLKLCLLDVVEEERPQARQLPQTIRGESQHLAFRHACQRRAIGRWTVRLRVAIADS